MTSRFTQRIPNQPASIILTRSAAVNIQAAFAALPSDVPIFSSHTGLALDALEPEP
jgi:hypothetical protein